MHVVHILIFLMLFSATRVNAGDIKLIKTFKNLFSSPKRNTSSIDPKEDQISIIIRTVRKRELERPCNDDELMTYLAEVQVINPESIINLSTLDELPVVCKQVSDTLEGMESYLKSCTIANDKDLYIQLLRGIARFVDVMCEKETKIKTNFVQYFPCLRHLHDDFENCYGPADWTEDIKKKDICCAYRQITDCYYTKAGEVCGRKAAHAIKKVVETVIQAVIPVHCPMMLDPYVKDMAPDNSHANKTHTSWALVLLFALATNAIIR